MRFLKSLVLAGLIAAGLYFGAIDVLGRAEWEGAAAASAVAILFFLWWRLRRRKKRRRSSPSREPIPVSVRRHVYARDNYTCAYCGRGGKNLRLTLDHVMPYSLGGSNDIGNLVTACRACNLTKGAKLMNASGLHQYATERRAWAGRERRSGCLRNVGGFLLLAILIVSLVFYAVSVR